MHRPHNNTGYFRKIKKGARTSRTPYSTHISESCLADSSHRFFLELLTGRCGGNVIHHPAYIHVFGTPGDFAAF